MNQAIPIHLICGFLGAGKTTLLQRILAQQPGDESLAVLVNEFGKLGVDGELLQGFASQVRELKAGCICCQSCATLHAKVLEAARTLEAAGQAVEVEHTTDLMRIHQMGVPMTPALVVDGQVVSAGRVLSPEQASQALRNLPTLFRGATP